LITKFLCKITLVYLGRFGRWFSFGKNRKTKILAYSSIVNFSIFIIILFIPNKRLVIISSNCQAHRFYDVMPSSYCDFGKKLILLLNGNGSVRDYIQDICVDAWALDLLPHSKRGLQANCNAGGFSFGIFISAGLFLSLTNPEFCSKWFGNAINKYTSSTDDEFSGALFSHSTVLKLYSLIIFLVLVFILFISLPDESPPEIKSQKSPCSSIFQSYKYFFSLRRNKTLLIWLCILSTCYIGLGPTLDLQNLKLRKLGISLATIGWIK